MGKIINIKACFTKLTHEPEQQKINS